MWPWTWLTPRSGTSRATASILAALTPTSSAPTRPGVWWTATPATWSRGSPEDLSCGVKRVGRRDPSARRDLRTLAGEALLQRRQEQQHAVRPAVVSHQADAPRLALEVAEAAADLDAELRQQPFAHRRVVHAGWDAHRIELRQPTPFDRRVLQAERGQAGLERPVIVQMPRPARLQSLLMHETQA